MKKLVLMFAIIGMIAAPASAALVDSVGPTAIDGFNGTVNLGGSGARSLVYSDTTAVGGYAPGVGIEFGDELETDKTGCPGCDMLDSISWAVYNSSAATAALTTVDLTMNIYDTSGGADPTPANLCASINWGTLAPGLNPGWYTVYSASDLCAYEMCCPDVMTVTLEYANAPVGSVPGTIIANPPTLGTSGDWFWKDNHAGTSGWYWFGGSPVANFYFEVGCCPEPSTLALLGLGALALIRRRR